MSKLPPLLSAALIALGVLVAVLILVLFVRNRNSARGGETRAAREAPGVSAAEPGSGKSPAEHGAFVAAVSAAIATVMGEHVGGIRIRSIKKLN